ncbi:MAG: polyribonucleotide nucleotidyltransferase [Candidatus Sericytochromatia bacterium]|nr:polyribonucleotide nucleotidyltransferase [Candidatus Sericytochromatia bacterium]
MTNIHSVEFGLGGRKVVLETGRMAPLAGAAVRVMADETEVLVTATASKSIRAGIDFFPLLVDYEERMYSVGRIPGSFHRREARPPENAILTARLIDRPIRPLFPKGYRNDVQVVAMGLATDQIDQPDMYAMIGASAALHISDIPFEGPIGAVRIGRMDDEWIINPTYQESEDGDLDLIVSGTKDAILMVEAGAKIVSEADMLEALELAHNEIKTIIGHIERLRELAGKPKLVPSLVGPTDVLKTAVGARVAKAVSAAAHTIDRNDRKAQMDTIGTETQAWLDSLADDDAVKAAHKAKPNDYKEVIGSAEKKAVRAMVLDEGKRLDGRITTEVRPISCEVGLISRVHGSGLFTRGTTQALSICTLGSPGDAQNLDNCTPHTEKKYLHHYNFPGFSTGEVKPNRGQSRREIGHGALAGRALQAVLPSNDDFPYTIRVVSEVLASNGSSSMASTCGSTLAMMDCGVPLKAMVAGVAMGMIKDGDKFAILTDILGDEDHLGDMDFKVTGTEKGITALQMDMKIQGISFDLLKQALEQARIGRLHILDQMKKVIDKPRAELSEHAPRLITIRIDPADIGTLIGPGGKTVKKIVEETGVKIDIEDDGRVFIFTPDAKAAKLAQDAVTRLTRRPEVGTVYTGKVVRIMNFGAFVEIFPGKDGMVHISQLAPHRVERVEDEVKVGDEVTVKVMEIDSQGRVNLSRKATMPGGDVGGAPSVGGGDDAGAPRRDRPAPRGDRAERPPARR